MADVAALFAAAILRRNPDSVVIPFDTKAYDVRIDPSDSILSLSERLAKYGGGGTDCSIPLRVANSTYRDRPFAGAVLVSDCESWVGTGRYGSTGVMTEWQQFVKNQLRLGGHAIASPKMVCIDIQPYGTTQAPERDDILNIGGFSDAVFNVVAAYLSDDGNRFVTEVESVELQHTSPSTDAPGLSNRAGGGFDETLLTETRLIQRIGMKLDRCCGQTLALAELSNGCLDGQVVYLTGQTSRRLSWGCFSPQPF